MLKEIALVGERFRTARIAAGFTGQKAAELLDISGAYLSQIEHGKRQAISIELIVKASRLFDVTTCYLLGMEQPPAFELMAKLHSMGFFTQDHYHALWRQVRNYMRECGLDPDQCAEALHLLGKENHGAFQKARPCGAVPSDETLRQYLETGKGLVAGSR